MLAEQSCGRSSSLQTPSEQSSLCSNLELLLLLDKVRRQIPCHFQKEGKNKPLLQCCCSSVKKGGLPEVLFQPVITHFGSQHLSSHRHEPDLLPLSVKIVKAPSLHHLSSSSSETDTTFPRQYPAWDHGRKHGKKGHNPQWSQLPPYFPTQA